MIKFGGSVTVGAGRVTAGLPGRAGRGSGAAMATWASRANQERACRGTRGNTFPGEVFFHLAVGALAWCGASPVDPLALEGLRERFLPEFAGRGRDRRSLQFAVLAAAALHGRVEPDLHDEVIWCRRLN